MPYRLVESMTGQLVICCSHHSAYLLLHLHAPPQAQCYEYPAWPHTTSSQCTISPILFAYLQLLMVLQLPQFQTAFFYEKQGHDHYQLVMTIHAEQGHDYFVPKLIMVYLRPLLVLTHTQVPQSFTPFSSWHTWGCLYYSLVPRPSKIDFQSGKIFGGALHKHSRPCIGLGTRLYMQGLPLWLVAVAVALMESSNQNQLCHFTPIFNTCYE